MTAEFAFTIRLALTESVHVTHGGTHVSIVIHTRTLRKIEIRVVTPMTRDNNNGLSLKSFCLIYSVYKNPIYFCFSRKLHIYCMINNLCISNDCVEEASAWLALRITASLLNSF